MIELLLVTGQTCVIYRGHRNDKSDMLSFGINILYIFLPQSHILMFILNFQTKSRAKSTVSVHATENVEEVAIGGEAHERPDGEWGNQQRGKDGDGH